MIKDRGNIKWTAMMLPEHVEIIREIYANQNKVVKPELDEQEIEGIERVICEGMAENLKLVFVYWKDGYFETIIGRINCVEQISRKLGLVNEFDERINLELDNIVDVKIKEDCYK